MIYWFYMIAVIFCACIVGNFIVKLYQMAAQIHRYQMQWKKNSHVVINWTIVESL